MGLTLGGAVLLGAMLAPTDPVLASAVQVSKPDDRDRLRRTLTGEAGLNDGTAFPFVMLGLGLYAGGLHSLGAGGWRWVAIDLLWAVTGGLGVGWLSGLWVGRAVLYLRRRFRESITADEMLTIGMIALVYGLALAIHTYAFLAVFAAAVAIRREEHLQNMGRSAEEAHREAAVMLPDGKPEADEAADVPQDLRRLAPAQMAQAQLQMTESLERLIEVTLVLLVGALISFRTFSHPAVWWFIPLLLIGIRPAVVMISTIRVRMVPAQRLLAGWFGIRGVGTIYYLAFALTHGVEKENPTEARVLVDFAVATVCVSVVLHGISATPLMDWYTRTRRGPSEPAAARLPGRSGAVE